MWNNAKDKTSDITFERVRELFDYNPKDGQLRWKVERQKVVKGGVAGYISKSDGYRYIGIDRHELLAHRLIWLWGTGDWPKCQIDHINRKRADNRWVNLREADNSQQMRNANAQSNNHSTGY